MQKNNFDTSFPLAELESILKQNIAPNAFSIDRSLDHLKLAFADLNKNIFSKVLFDEQLTSGDRLAIGNLILEKIAEHSGALAFCSAQFVGASRRFFNGHNTSLNKRVIKDAKSELMTIGVATTHLTSPTPPMLAKKVKDGFILNGTAPWVSGYDIFSHVIIGAKIGTNGLFLGLIPFSSQANSNGDKLTFSEVQDLTVMKGTNTVSINFHNYFVPEESILTNIPDSDKPLPPLPLPFYSFPIGCARAVLKLAIEGIPKFQSSSAKRYLDSITQEIEKCSKKGQKILYLTDLPELGRASLENRIHQDSILNRTIAAAMPLVGGKMVIRGHPLERLCREAQVYSISLLSEQFIDQKLNSLSIEQKMEN